MPIKKLSLIKTVILLLTGLAASAEIPDNLKTENLVAWCIMYRWDAEDRNPAERVRMLKELGLKRVAINWRKGDTPDFEEEIKQYRKHDIEYFAFWNENEEAFALFEKYGLKPQIWKTNPSPKIEGQEAKIQNVVNRFLPHVKRAKELGSQFGLYNHGGWGGMPENLVAVCEAFHELGYQNVGIVYNFHHAHYEVDAFAAGLERMMPHLLCLNLNGMADPTNIDVTVLENKILPIGAGVFEAEMIQTVIQSGYDGPIGIIGHLPDQDVEITLINNLEGLDTILSALH